MFIICFGGRKTGSTLSFQLVSALLEARGHGQADIPEGAVDRERVQHFAPSKWSAAPAWLALLAAQAADPRLHAIKFHGPCTPELAALVDEGKVLAVVNTRDPRDTALALRDAGERNSRGAFSRIDSMHDALGRARKGCEVTGPWLRDRALIADYEQVAFDSERFLGRVATYLQLAPPAADEVRDIRARADSASATRNLMRSRRFLHDWTTAQAAFYSDFFCEELRKSAAVPEAEEAGICYPAITLPRSATRVTERTFVVLGCPRGGTSLLAGALHAAGIYMGDFSTAQYEDKAFKLSPAEVRRDRNIEARLLPLIQERNQRYRFWGWKLPNSIYYIRQIQHLLVNPVFLFVYRDERAIARSSAKHDGKVWWLHRRRLMQVARNHTQRVKDFEASLDKDVARAVFRVEEIQRDVPGFLDQLAAVLAPEPLDRDAVAAFVNPGGGYVPARARE